MSRILAVVISPIVLFLLSFIIGFVVNTGNAFEQEATSPIMDLFVYYVILFLFFLILGAPLSIVLDKLKGLRFINYSIAGLVIGLILELLSYFEVQMVEVRLLFIYALAGFSYYLSLLFFEKIYNRLYAKYTG